MFKRFLSVFLSAVIMVGVFCAGTIGASAEESKYTVSIEAKEIAKDEYAAKFTVNGLTKDVITNAIKEYNCKYVYLDVSFEKGDVQAFYRVWFNKSGKAEQLEYWDNIPVADFHQYLYDINTFDKSDIEVREPSYSFTTANSSKFSSKGFSFYTAGQPNLDIQNRDIENHYFFEEATIELLYRDKNDEFQTISKDVAALKPTVKCTKANIDFSKGFDIYVYQSCAMGKDDKLVGYFNYLEVVVVNGKALDQLKEKEDCKVIVIDVVFEKDNCSASYQFNGTHNAEFCWTKIEENFPDDIEKYISDMNNYGSSSCTMTKNLDSFKTSTLFKNNEYGYVPFRLNEDTTNKKKVAEMEDKINLLNYIGEATITIGYINASNEYIELKSNTAVLPTATNKPATDATPEVSETPSEKDISSLSVSKISNYAYTGKARKPAVTIMNGDTKLKKGTDYTLTYANNTEIGTASVTIKGKGNYTGSKTIEFEIVPAKTTLKASKKSDTKVTLTWDKVAGAEKYQIYYSENGGKYKKLATVSGTKTSYTNSKLDFKKNDYKFKIRAYDKVDGKTYYGSYSKVVTVK